MDEERLPKNLQGLFKFCMTAGNDFSSQDIHAMDPERRQWLQDALNDMSVDVIKLLKDNIRVLLTCLKDHSSAAVTEKIRALSTLLNIVDDLDLANDFVKLDGLHLLLFLNAEADSPAEIRELACECTAVVCQNNPFAQKAAVDVGLVEAMLTELRLYRDAVALPRKQLSALSAIVRASPEAMQRFEEQGGVLVLLGLLQHYSDESILTKVTFFFKAACADAETIVLDAKAIGQLWDKIAKDGRHRDYHEHVFALLVQLSETTHGRQWLEELAADPSVALKETLTRRLTELAGQEEHEESVLYIKTLLAMLSGEQPLPS